MKKAASKTDFDEKLLSANELAKHLGIDSSYVRKLSGIVFHPVERSGKTRLFFKSGDSVRSYLKHVKEVLGGSAADKELTNEKLLKVRAEREYRQNMLAEQRGRLHDGELIKQLYGDRVRACRETLLGIPNKLSQLLAAETDIA